MELKQKLESFKERGFTYNYLTGEIFSYTGKLITSKYNGYIGCSLEYNKEVIQVYGHQLGWFLYYNEVPTEIDHINRIRNDNRIENLRDITHQQNGFNRNAKGYYWYKPNKKWLAQIVVNKKHIYLGSFTNEQDAREAYLQAKEQYHKI